MYNKGFANLGSLKGAHFSFMPLEFSSNGSILKFLGSRKQEVGSHMHGFEFGGLAHVTSTYVVKGQSIQEGSLVPTKGRRVIT